MIEVANVLIRRHAAYLHTCGMTVRGVRISVEPVYKIPVKAQEMVAALEKLTAMDTPKIPDPTDGDWKPYWDLLPRHAGVKSWNALAKGGQQYTVDWASDGIHLIPSKHDRQGRFEYDWSKAKVYPKDTPLITIVEAILEDARSRPELGLASDTGP